MISRYTRPDLGRIWSEQRKLEAWLEVELAVCEVLAEQGVIPKGDIGQIRSRASFDLHSPRSSKPSLVVYAAGMRSLTSVCQISGPRRVIPP